MTRVYTEEALFSLSDEEFYERLGIGKILFTALCERLEQYRDEQHRQGGRPNHLSVFSCLVISLLYMRQYMTQTIIADIMGEKKWAISRAFHWVLDALIKKGCLRLIGNRKAGARTYLLIDVTEIFINRPKRNQRRYYSGKKKHHTVKVQIIYDITKCKIISFYIANGRTHDFKMLKDSDPHFNELLKGLADSGYQGISKIWSAIETPIKKPHGGQLTDDDKKFNHVLSSIRIGIEHVNAWLKRFRILKDRYRGRLRDLWKAVLFACAVFNIEYPNV